MALALGIAFVGLWQTPAFARHRRPTPHGPSVQIGDQATLSADRRTADVTLTVTCPRGATQVPIRVTVEQGSTKASASSGSDYKCTGGAQRVAVPVTASSSFHTGSATASASAHFRSGTSVSNTSSSRGIQLV